MANDFLTTYAPLANDIAGRTGMDPSVVLGIIDTETGGGKHVLGNNIFGITPPGGVARYPDVQTAANAFITLMQTPRYRGVAAAGDPASQATALVKGGYNTVNPQYASIVANKALNIGRQLGYQDSGGGNAPSGPAVYSTTSQPVATADQPTATSYSDSPAPATAPQQPTQQPAATGSAKDRVLSDTALGGTGTAAAPASGGSAKDRVLNDPALKTTETTATTQDGSQTTARGVARNVAAGVLEGSGGTVNILHDPIGNLVFRPITTAGAFLYDLGAKSTGLYNPLTPEQRADLTSDSPEYQQPGTRLAQAAGAGDVVPASPAERYVRAGTAGATSALQLAPGVVVPALAGAGGGVGGQVAADYAPDWAKPYAQLGGMLVGGAAGGLAAAGMARRGAAAGNALSRFASGPVDEHPLAPREPAYVSDVNALSSEAQRAAAARPEAPTSPTGVGSPAAAVPGATPKTAADAKQIASAYYTRAESSGGTLTPQFTNKFIDSVTERLPQTEAGKAVAGDNPVTTLTTRLESLRDKPMTLKAAQEVDEALGDLVSSEYGPTGLSKDGYKIADIQRDFRSRIANAESGDIEGGSAGFDALNNGRKAWSQAMKMDDLERIQARADRTLNPATSYKTQVKNLVTNARKVRGYSAEEIVAVEKAGDSGLMADALRVFGNRLVPLAVGASGIGGGILGNLAAAGVAHVATTGLRNAATALAARRLQNAIGVIGRSVPPNPLQQPPP